MPNKNFVDGINEALIYSMKENRNVICYGLGVTDPKAIFGTTANLEQLYGSQRVFDVPTSENALTGIAIGASLGGLVPVVTHQRLDFFLLAMDQLVNSAAKWNYMFGSQISVPITIRLIIGRGWGQGPTHSQNLQSWFAHIPGLKVVMPSDPNDAKGLLLSSIKDPNPVIFLEHRWLHNTQTKKLKAYPRVPIGKAKVKKRGKDITIIAMSYLVLEALKASYILEKLKIHAEVIDLRSISPIDWNTIYKSVEKTNKVIVLDTGFTTGSIAGEIIANISIKKFHILDYPPQRMAMPDIPEPTSHALTKNFYISYQDIVKKIMTIFKKDLKKIKFDKSKAMHDIPGSWFKGPF